MPTQLFRISTAGTRLRQITTGARAVTEPAFSPDGRRIALTRVFAGIFVVDAAGHGLHRLTGNPNDRFPVWSPDGKGVAFVHPTPGRARLAVISADGRRQRTLRLEPEPIGRPSWLPDGKSLVVATASGSFVQVSAANGRLQRRLRPSYDTRAGTPSWTLAPNGRTIAAVGRTPDPDGFAVYVSRITSTRPRRLVDGGSFPGWTPDSRGVVYATGSGLAVVSLARARPRLILLPGGGEVAPAGDAPPAWQP